jgi:hypothetical protein
MRKKCIFIPVKKCGEEGGGGVEALGEGGVQGGQGHRDIPVR